MPSGGAFLFSTLDIFRQYDKINSSPKCVLGISAVISGVGCLKSAYDVKEDYYG